MKDDTQKALEELQEQLLSDDTVTDETFSDEMFSDVKFSDENFLGEKLFDEKFSDEGLSDEGLSDEGLSDDALLEDIINEVHAEQKEDLRMTDKQPLEAAPQAYAAPGKQQNEDLVQTVLMFVVSGLSLGVSCLLIYWLVNYL